MVQANSCTRERCTCCSSASQKRRSNDALWATSGCVPTKSAASRITSRAGGAARTIWLLMPVSASMKGGTHTPAFIRLW